MDLFTIESRASLPQVALGFADRLYIPIGSRRAPVRVAVDGIEIGCPDERAARRGLRWSPGAPT